MTEVAPNPEYRVPTSDVPPIIRAVAILQGLGSLAAIILGLIMGFSMLFYYPLFGGAIVIMGFIIAKVGLGVAGALASKDNTVRKTLLIVDSLWIIVYSVPLLLLLVLVRAYVYYSFLVAGVILPLIVVIILMSPSIRQDFV